jgi:hypothetical protein
VKTLEERVTALEARVAELEAFRLRVIRAADRKRAARAAHERGIRMADAVLDEDAKWGHS